MHVWWLTLTHACLLKLVLWVCWRYWNVRTCLCLFLSVYVLFLSLREIMVTSLHWLLLLWGIQGLCAQDYEEDYEEEVVVTPKRKVNQFASNTIPRNGNGKSKVLSFLEFVSGLFVPLMLLLWKVVWSLCRWHMLHFFYITRKKKALPQVKKIEHDPQQGHCWRMQSTWIDHIS